MHLTSQLQRVLRRAHYMCAILRRIHAYCERELTRLAGCNSNDKHLVRKRNEGLAPKRGRTNLVRRLCGGVVQVEVATIVRRLTMIGEV